MSIIGIITNEKDTKEIEEKIKEYNIQEENNVIIINKSNIENIKNVKFDFIIIFEKIEIDEIIEELIKKSKYAIINADHKEINNISDKSHIITYGFNSKANVTIVSNENDEIILDIQKEIELLDNEKIESQEIKMRNNFKRKYLYIEISMKILTILLKI